MDTFRTIAEPSPEQLFKEKGSRFFSYAYPIASESEVKPILEALRKTHHGAVHFCYAWQIGTTQISYRANDDGEPSHTAGAPIYGQIQSFGLTNVLVVVVRFFGGIKLGVGGLISAYRTSAQMALDAAEIIQREIRASFSVATSYALLNRVMRAIRENRGEISAQTMEMDCRLEVSVPLAHADSFETTLQLIMGIEVRRQ